MEGGKERRERERKKWREKILNEIKIHSNELLLLRLDASLLLLGENRKERKERKSKGKCE